MSEGLDYEKPRGDLGTHSYGGPVILGNVSQLASSSQAGRFFKCPTSLSSLWQSQAWNCQSCRNWALLQSIASSREICCSSLIIYPIWSFQMLCFLIFKNRTDPKGSEHGKLRLWSKFPLKVLTTGEILYMYQSYHFHAWSLFLSLQVWEEIDNWDKGEVPRLYLLVLLFLFHSKITIEITCKKFQAIGLSYLWVCLGKSENQ